MSDFDTETYKTYIEFQVNDNLAVGYDNQYLTYLESNILKGYDFKNAAILDIGSRSFDGWDYFIKNHNNRITGIDIGREGLEYCKQHNKTGMLEVDAHKMADYFLPKTFDFITAFHCFEHMLDLPKVLENSFKLLNPGGYLYMAVPIPSYDWGPESGHRYNIPSVQSFVDMCSKAGFSQPIYTELISDFRFRPEQEMLGLFKK